MDNYFQNKTVVVLSPQPWSHLMISKHHYARTLALNNQVFFVGPPSHGRSFSFSVQPDETVDNLFIVTYSLPLPNWFRFKLPRVYKAIVPYYLQKVASKIFPSVDVCFDFGCYVQFDTLAFIKASRKIFFPVDDFADLRPVFRGADVVVTVSLNIQQKYAAGRCHFLNHGLAEEFASEANADQMRGKAWTEPEKISVGYAGNLFMRFIDVSAMMAIIDQNSHVEFHFFGSNEPDLGKAWQVEWMGFLNQAPNVVVHGPVLPHVLVKEYRTMDAFLLCYKPDRKDYHGENSHKIMEYLSTGKVTVSSLIHIYENTGLIEMPVSSDNDALPELFSHVVSNLREYNSLEKMNKRRQFALQHTYLENLKRLSELLTNEKK